MKNMMMVKVVRADQRDRDKGYEKMTIVKIMRKGTIIAQIPLEIKAMVRTLTKWLLCWIILESEEHSLLFISLKLDDWNHNLKIEIYISFFMHYIFHYYFLFYFIILFYHFVLLFHYIVLFYWFNLLTCFLFVIILPAVRRTISDWRLTIHFIFIYILYHLLMGIISNRIFVHFRMFYCIKLNLKI